MWSYLERIADALLDVSRQVPRARNWAVTRVISLIPSGESLLDQQLIERLTRSVRPAEPAAGAAAQAVLEWIGRDESDAEDYRDRMNEAFTWLHALPPTLFRDVRGLAIEKARKTAGDRRRAIYFASLFTAYGDYEGEREVLSLARSKLPAGRRFEQLVSTMERLASAAGRNACRFGTGGD